MYDIVRFERPATRNALCIVIREEALHHRPEELCIYPAQIYEAHESDSAVLRHVVLALWGLVFAYDCVATIDPGSETIQIISRTGVPLDDRFMVVANRAVIQALALLGHTVQTQYLDRAVR